MRSLADVRDSNAQAMSVYLSSGNTGAGDTVACETLADQLEQVAKALRAP